MIKTITRYTPERRQEWDDFVGKAKNGTFLLMRGYMDYHSDRFRDHSLMFYNENDQLVAVLPANEADYALWSHQGLTYGGLILSASVHTPDVGQLFRVLHSYLYDNKLRKLMYKCVPSIYHRLPAEEDEYWLWRYGAQLVGCNIAATVDLRSDMMSINKRKQSYAKRLAMDGFSINENTALEDFWPVLTENLKATYGADPVHTLSEMQRLQAAFPDNIRCWTVASPDGEVMGGMVLYVTPNTVHTQYISASEDGKQQHVLDYLFVNVVRHYQEDGRYRYFDFGTSNERGGMILNESLTIQKELFGGRGIAYKTYCMNVNRQQ